MTKRVTFTYRTVTPILTFSALTACDTAYQQLTIAPGGYGDRVSPERRLADPRRAFENEGLRCAPGLLERPDQRHKLVFPTDDLPCLGDHLADLWAEVGFLDRNTGKLLHNADKALPLDRPQAIPWYFEQIAERGFELARKLRTEAGKVRRAARSVRTAANGGNARRGTSRRGSRRASPSTPHAERGRPRRRRPCGRGERLRAAMTARRWSRR